MSIHAVIMKQNLVFFMTDQQRADTINMNVNGVSVTPALTALSKISTDFKTAYNACPLCVPARTALATGIEPLTSKMFLNSLNSKTAPNIPTIHKMLYDNGYEVGHIGVNHITVFPPLEETLPFSVWESDETYAAYSKRKGLDISRKKEEITIVNELCDGEYKKRPYSNAFVSPWQHDIKYFKDVYYANKAVEYLQKPHKKPFALFVYLWAPHPPLKVPQKYLDMFPENKITLPEGTMQLAQGQPASRKTGAPMQLAQGLTESDWRRAWGAHCALTRLCDDQLAKVLDTLDETSLSDNTLVVFTTDHGEHLGQHQMYQKMEMYESAVRVPAIFKMPHTAPKSYTTAISHIDFVPTVLDLLKVPYGKLDGVSHAKSILSYSEPLKRDIFSIYCGNHQIGDCRRMIVRDNYKYIFDGTDEELYDLKNDSAEMDNLAVKHEFLPLCKQLYSALVKHFNKNDFLNYGKGNTNA